MYRVRDGQRPTGAHVGRWLSGLMAVAAAASGGVAGCDGVSSGGTPVDGAQVTLTYLDDTGLPPWRSHDDGVAEAVPQSWVIAQAEALGEEVSEYDNSWVGGPINDLSDDELVAMGGERVEMTDGRFTFHVAEGPYMVCLSTGNISGCHLADLPAQGALSATWGEGGFWVGPS